MKRKDLARRAASAAMAACMMFTLSAPALAESTDALMQLSIGSYRSSSLLSEENGFPAIKVNGKTVDEGNIGSILGSQNAGKLSYDATTNTLRANETIHGNLTIDAPGVNIELHNTSSNPVVFGKLTVTNAQDVKVTSQNYFAVFDAVEISCDGEVEITCEEGNAVAGNVTVKQASKVAISGKSNTNHIVTGDVTIACPVPVTIQNKGTGGMANSIVYSGGKYVYSTTEGGMPVDPSSTPINAEANAVYITPVVARTITLTHATVDVPDNKAYAGQTVTVTPDDRTAAGYQFVRWEVVSGIADAELIRSTTDNTATFTMPDEDVELKARYNKLYTITAEKGMASLPQAIQGTEVTITADTIPGRKFDHWEVKNGGVTLANLKSAETTFKMLEGNVTVEAKYKAIQPITVNQGTYTVNGTATTEAVKGDQIVATAQDAPAGTKFAGWTATGISLTEEQQKSPVIEFVMPKNAVELTAQYKTLHPVTVTNGKADKPTAAAGDIVTITPNNRLSEKLKFDHWEVRSGEVTLSGAKTATFTMPDAPVVLEACYNKLYTITATKGTASLTQAIQGTEVTITADTIPGRKFDHWEVKNGGVILADPTSVETTFKMLEDNVTVEAKYKAIQPITVNQGTYTVNGTAAAEAVKGDAIVATADSAPAGQKFSHWEVTGVDGLTKEQLENETLKFTMPRGEVTLKAVFKTLHKIGVKFSTADKETAIEGETVTITAESRPGYVFDRWEVNNGDVAVFDKNAEKTTFVMPDKPVTAVAKYKKLLGITVNSGKAYVEGAVTDAALKGKLVDIKADKIKGKRFDQWEIVSGDVILDDLHAPEARFTMPETAVEITAAYNDLHTIKVNSGTADVEEAVIGDTVKIKAESREGYVFDHWEVNYGDVAVADKNAEETTFTMPDSMVVLTARYKALQSITLENGKAYAGGEEITTAKKGTEVAIKADDLGGKVFDHWEIVSGNVTLKDANKAETTFTMPAEPISLEAVYNTIHSIHTTFCTADPASAIVGTEITVTAESRKGYEFDGWAVSDGVELYDEHGLTAKFTMPDNDVTIEAKYKQYHSIEVSKGVATDAEGNPIFSAVEGTEIWIEIDREQRNPDEFEFKHWESGPEDLEIADRKAERTCFTMPDEDVNVEAKFLHLREITVHDGTTYVEDEESGIAKAGQTVTVKADEIPGLKFDHWTVDSENVTLTTVDEATGEATFEMVNEPVELTAHYKAMVTVFSDPAKFSEDTGEESVAEWADVGEMAAITAEIDEATFPGMVFDYWEIVTPADLKTENIESQTIEFKVPKSEVKLVAHWKSDALNPSTDPDAPLDPDFDVDDGSGAAGAIVAGAALGGAAVWGGYEITTRVILNDLLPEGAAIPANRGELAALLWQTAGKPEPAAQPAFADVADAELAKAAQWCVEQGLLDAKDGKFDPNGWMPKFKTIEVWKKAFPKQ